MSVSWSSKAAPPQHATLGTSGRSRTTFRCAHAMFSSCAGYMSSKNGKRPRPVNQNKNASNSTFALLLIGVLMLVDEAWLWDCVIGGQLPARPCVARQALPVPALRHLKSVQKPQSSASCMAECTVLLLGSTLWALTRTKRTAPH